MCSGKQHTEYFASIILKFGVVVAGEWPSRLRRCDRIGRFSVQALPGAQLGLTTQPRHEALTDLGNCKLQ